MSQSTKKIDKSALPLMEHFSTIQGEGAHSGKAAYFIRLGGCDVGCTWCDVKESWPAEAHPLASIEALLGYTNEAPTDLVVITGGEPLMYNLDELTSALKKAGKHCHVETSGTHPLSGNWDWITFSPKRFKKPLAEYYEAAHELKVVISHRNDLRWAEQHAKKVGPSCRLFLQPEWDQADSIIPLIIDFVKENPEWEISLQTHKFLQVP